MSKRHKFWTTTEEKLLIENYSRLTIKELEALLPGRDRESINSKIKRLKKEGKIKEEKNNDAVQRAYLQRGEKNTPFLILDKSHFNT